MQRKQLHSSGHASLQQHSNQNTFFNLQYLLSFSGHLKFNLRHYFNNKNPVMQGLYSFYKFCYCYHLVCTLLKYIYMFCCSMHSSHDGLPNLHFVVFASYILKLREIWKFCDTSPEHIEQYFIFSGCNYKPLTKYSAISRK